MFDLQFSWRFFSQILWQENKIILAARDDGNIAFYSSLDLEEIKLIEAHDNCVTSIIIDKNEQNKFYSASWDGCINYYDINNDIPIYSLDNAHYGRISGLASHGPMLASVASDGYARLFDRRQDSFKECTHVFDLKQAGSAIFWGDSNSNEIFVGTDSGEIVVLDSRFNELCRQSVHKSRVRSISANVNIPGSLIF